MYLWFVVSVILSISSRLVSSVNLSAARMTRMVKVKPLNMIEAVPFVVEQ